MDRKKFFPEYARILYPEAASESAAGLEAVGRAEVELAKALGPNSKTRSHPLIWHGPPNTG